MPTISIEKLFPAEYALRAVNLQALTEKLARGEALKPIKLIKYAESLFVRDGNHRVRAMVDFHQARGFSIPAIEYQEIHDPLPYEMPSFRRKEYECFMSYFGNGPKAFLMLKVSSGITEDEYVDFRIRAKNAIINPHILDAKASS